MSLVVREELTNDEVAAALEVTEEAAAADGVRPMGESALLRLRDGAGAVLAYDGDALAGVAILDGDAGELAVRPSLRRRGHGRALVTALAGQVESLNVWAHGELPAAVGLGGALGFERFRALWKMARPLGGTLPEVAVPAGVRLRTFETGRDEDAWVGINARAFADHPEQGRWTRTDLERREREPWFSPEGFFLAERDGEPVGFHWTKVHEEDGPVGEVYVVGVDPSAQGLGLGRVLTLAGLHHLQDLGLPSVILYVDESNTAATALYGKLGFERRSTDAMYRNSR
ncbi:mycothiol synthase [Actinoallomurus bryophytorum]|uniref:Mycothiol acetyltransferase n=2 Tax=Actinoallomurus bryophytorum TaxID=1490222 RepID=A0A543CHG3_9ACTN|nr:mycothiol synthase [Actinoallomurus bryophytorum]